MADWPSPARWRKARRRSPAKSLRLILLLRRAVPSLIFLADLSAVRAEPVEAPPFPCEVEEGQGFDRLSPNVVWHLCPELEPTSQTALSQLRKFTFAWMCKAWKRADWFRIEDIHA